MLDIGIIGNGYHSKRIQKILKKRKIKFFIYKPNNKDYFDKNKFNILKKKKIIFILSPNETHFKYIKILSKNRYIFCEKPPVNSKKDLNKLKNINKNKIYFNYNTRFSKLSDLIKIKDKFKLGKLVYANFMIGHGLALKKEYVKNWKSNKRLCPKGVFEILSIHLIDLVNFHFKIKKIEKPSLINISKKGNSYDTSHIKLILNENIIVDIFSSFSTPLLKRNTLIFENGKIEQDDESISIRGPALNLDKNYFFIKPKLIKKIYITDGQDYLKSLNESVDYFLKVIKDKKHFKSSITNCSIKSNSLLF